MDDTQPSVKRRKLSHDETQRDELQIDINEREQNIVTANNAAVVDAAKSSLPESNSETSINTQLLSKNQLKKLRKKQEWEAGRDLRKAKRKEKNQERKAKRKEKKLEEAEERKANGLSPVPDARVAYRRPIRLPVTFLIDCGFDDKMLEKERISLGSQLTRAYSDNSKGPFQSHLYISSWNGVLKHRFDTLLNQHYKNWKGTTFMSEDFVDAAKVAAEDMKSSESDRFAGIFAKYNQEPQRDQQPRPDVQVTAEDQSDGWTASPQNTNVPSREELQEAGEIIYLTSDSPDTLTELKPFSIYIIGGLVDKNRHKGICYKTACDRGIKTAKLPIGEYMEMQSRYVLTTNHVVEIMVRYLECGDWGESFIKVMPKRKGGKLRGQAQNHTQSSGDENGDQEDEDDEEVESVSNDGETSLLSTTNGDADEVLPQSAS